jgi:ABC-type glutathione transport system ATPase component
LPSIEEIRQANIQNMPTLVSRLFKKVQAPRILSMLDNYEDIERSIELSNVSGFSLDKFAKESKNSLENLKTIHHYLSLKNISLTINRGELVCLTGKHGSGKTTLLQSILGETLYIDNETMGKY